MESEAITENTQRGLIGAAIGCLLGGAVWAIAGYFGYFAFVAGLLIVFLGAKGYEMGAGILSKKACILSLFFQY